MAERQVYHAVFAQVEDDQTLWFSIDDEAMVGSMDGHVWVEEDQDWNDDWRPGDDEAYTLLSNAVTALNAELDRKRASAGATPDDVILKPSAHDMRAVVPLGEDRYLHLTITRKGLSIHRTVGGEVDNSANIGLGWTEVEDLLDSIGAKPLD
jgi:hypothetical protein